jgi:hypothetical protein
MISPKLYAIALARALEVPFCQRVGIVESPSGDANVINCRSGAVEKSQFSATAGRQFECGHITDPGRINAAAVVIETTTSARRR